MVLKWWCPDCGIARYPGSPDARACAWKYDGAAHVEPSGVEYRCCICLAHRGNDHLCAHCTDRWDILAEFERAVEEHRANDPVAFLSHVKDVRAMIGQALQYRLDLIVINLLLETSAGVKTLEELVANRELRNVCKDGTTEVSLWGAQGTLDLSVCDAARLAALSEKGKPVKGSKSTISNPLRMRMLASAAGVTALVLDGVLVSLNLSGNASLSALPVDELAAVSSLRSIECLGCPRLFSPPPEIAVQGGKAVMAYIKCAKENGVGNTNIELMIIGKAESGKTCVKEALVSHSAAPCENEQRARYQPTVALETFTWDLRRRKRKVHIKARTGIVQVCRRYPTPLDLFLYMNRPALRHSCKKDMSFLKVVQDAEPKACAEWQRIIARDYPDYCMFSQRDFEGAEAFSRMVMQGGAQGFKTLVARYSHEELALKIAASQTFCVATSSLDSLVWSTAPTQKAHQVVLRKKETLETGMQVWVWCGIIFNIKDLGGHPIYRTVNSLYMVKRAIYMLVWRVVRNNVPNSWSERQELQEMVTDWLDQLQMRVPGAQVLLVVTHVDCLRKEEVERQVKVVQSMVQSTLNRLRLDSAKGGHFIPPLTVFRDGRSLRVRSLERQGIGELTRALIDMAHDLPWWQEIIPKCFMQLQQQLAKMASKRKVAVTEHMLTDWVTWEEYADVARACKLDDTLTQIATNFLHTNRFIQYFGRFDFGHRQTARDKVVFIRPHGIVNVIKGLIRHERDTLLSYVLTEAQGTSTEEGAWLPKIDELTRQGVLSRDLVPFLWPSGSTLQSTRFWEWANQQDEARLWSEDGKFVHLCIQQQDYDNVLILLQALDLIHPISDTKYLVPALVPQVFLNRIDARALDSTDCGIRTSFYFTNVPHGFLEMLVVRCRQFYTHVDFSATVASFYARGIKAQIIVVRNESIESEGEQRQVIALKCMSCTKQQMLQIESQVAELQVLYSGMRLLVKDRDCRDIEEPIQVRIIEALPVFQASVSILEKRWRGEERTVDGPFVPPQQQAARAQDGSIIWHRDALCSVLASPFRDAGLSSADVSIVSVDLDAHRTVDRRFNIKVRIERLKQDPDTVQVLFNAVQEQDIDAELVPTFRSLSRTIKRLLLDADRDSPESAQDLIIHTGGGADQVDMKRVRAVLVCMDANISSNDDALQEFKRAVDLQAGSFVIPIVCPGYVFPNKIVNGRMTTDINFHAWWPTNMNELKDHALFVNLQNRAEWRSRVELELLPAINSFLSAWRGHSPHPKASSGAEDQIQIPCFQCLHDMISEPSTFSAKYLQDDLRDWNAAQNQRSIEGDKQDPEKGDTGPGVSPETEGEQVKEQQAERARRGLMVTCDRGHQVPAKEILAKSVTFECVACPECERSRTWPPHCFNRSLCIGQLSREGFSASRAHMLTCPTCEAANRPARVRLLGQVVVPELFITYFPGEEDEAIGKSAMQEWIEERKARVELGTQALCWFDAAGAVRSGQANLADMEEGIRNSRAVLLFLTDGYIMSNDCIRILLACFAHKKYVIPILMPDVGQELGWSGPGADAQDWWEHCRIISSNVNPNTGQLLSWAPLAQFSPVDMRSETAAGELEVVFRLKSCLMAGGFVEDECRLLHSLWHGKAIFCSFKEALGSNRLVVEARAHFDAVDNDGDGHITLDELRRAFPQLTQEAAEELMHYADYNTDGRIDFEEWYHIVQLLAAEPRSLRSSALNASQRSHAASAPAAKLYPVGVCEQQLLAECRGLDREHARLLIAEADADEDGFLTFDELMSVIETAA